MNKRTKKSPSADIALVRLQKYCAFTERTAGEVIKKMQKIGLANTDAEIVMDTLKKNGFINETRFARAFAGGKFRIKKWGKRKIEIEMRKKGLPEELIEKGLDELPENEYINTLDALLQKKWKQIKRQGKERQQQGNEQQANRQKLIRYALQKGYEMELTMQRVKRIIILQTQ